MKILDKLKLYFFGSDGQKIDASSSYNWMSRFFNFGLDYTYNGENQQTVIDSYGSNPYFFTVVDTISRILAALPKTLIDTETGKPIENPNREQRALQDLLEEPNDLEGQYEFYYQLASNLLIGNLYVYRERPAGFQSGLPGELYIPISSDVCINERFTNSLTPPTYSFTYKNVSFNNIPAEDVLHLRRPNIIQDSDYGFSTLQPSAPLYSTSNEIFKSGYSLHKNKGIQGVLYGKGGTVLRPDEQRDMQRYYDKEFGNSTKMGKVKIVSSEIGYFPMGVNPADLQSVEMNLDLLRAICAMFGAPSQLFGDVAASTYSNMEQAERAFYMNSILPLARRIDKALNAWLVGKDSSYAYKVDESQMSIVQDLKTDLINNAISLFNARLITIEEARLMVNEDFKETPEELMQNPQSSQNVNEEDETEEE